MQHQQPAASHLFNIGDVCVDRTKYTPAKTVLQQVQIRRFNDDGSKAIVHYVHCPAGMVFAVNVKLLNTVDADGFLCPSPYMCIYKRKAQESTSTTTTTDGSDDHGSSGGGSSKRAKNDWFLQLVLLKLPLCSNSM